MSQARSRKILATAIVVALAATTASCSTGTRTFQLTFPGNDSGPLAIAPLPVELIDHARIVIDFREGEPTPGGPAAGATALAGNAKAVVVTWIGGACDDHVSIDLDGSQNAPHLTIATSSADGCRLLGVGRSVVIDLNVAIRPENFTVKER